MTHVFIVQYGKGQLHIHLVYTVTIPQFRTELTTLIQDSLQLLCHQLQCEFDNILPSVNRRVGCREIGHCELKSKLLSVIVLWGSMCGRVLMAMT